MIDIDGLQLSEEMLNGLLQDQGIKVDDGAVDQRVTFDSRGSLMLDGYDNEGKRVYRVQPKQIEVPVKTDDRYFHEKMDALDRSSKFKRLLFILILGLITIVSIGVIGILVYLKVR